MYQKWLYIPAVFGNSIQFYREVITCLNSTIADISVIARPC
jgi:hypothetical protein